MRRLRAKRRGDPTPEPPKPGPHRVELIVSKPCRQPDVKVSSPADRPRARARIVHLPDPEFPQSGGGLALVVNLGDDECLITGKRSPAAETWSPSHAA